MKNLARFFSIVEMTKQVPRYGWTTVGFANEEIDTLAEHHFMVTMMTLLLATDMESRGMKIDVRKSITMSLGHDLSELFGGDVATPLGMVNPEIKRLSRIIEAHTTNYLGDMLKNPALKEDFQSWCDEEREQKTDEAKLVKLADRLEAELYKETRYRPVRYTERNKKYVEKAILSIPPAMKDKDIQKYCSDFAHCLLEAVQKKELRNAPRERLTDPTKKVPQMRGLADLCAILQISKEMPRYGWGFARFSLKEMDKISEHNYVLAVMSLLVTSEIERLGIKVDVRRTIEMSLIHDLSKLFGGDLSAPWAQANPDIRAAANEIKKTAISLLATISGNPKLQSMIEERYLEASENKTDEAILVRILGQLEDYLYREIVRRPKYTEKDTEYIKKNISSFVEKLSDAKLQQFVQKLIYDLVELIHSEELRHSPLYFQEK